MLQKGLIALDIDGTVTTRQQPLDKEVQKFFEVLVQERWNLLFVTGRTFSLAMPVLKHLKQPFFLAVQNGAALFQMPEERCLFKHYLSSDDIDWLNRIIEKHGTGLLVESGKEKDDLCFYRPEFFSDEDRVYLEYRMAITPAPWQPVSDFAQLSIKEFAVGKYFAKKEISEKIALEIQTERPNTFEVITIRDPFREGYHLTLINAIGATKGKIVNQMRIIGKPLIVAGDDYNDVDMLNRADVKIVMGNAPQELLALGDILAPSAEELGIIPALKKAIKKVGA